MQNIVLYLPLGAQKCKIDWTIRYFQALLCFYTRIFQISKVFKVIMQLSFHL